MQCVMNRIHNAPFATSAIFPKMGDSDRLMIFFSRPIEPYLGSPPECYTQLMTQKYKAVALNATCAFRSFGMDSIAVLFFERRLFEITWMGKRGDQVFLSHGGNKLRPNTSGAQHVVVAPRQSVNLLTIRQLSFSLRFRFFCARRFRLIRWKFCVGACFPAVRAPIRCAKGHFPDQHRGPQHSLLA